MTIKEPTERKMNGRYSYTKQYSSLRDGLIELFELVPILKDSLLDFEHYTRLVNSNSKDNEIAARVIFDAAVENINNDFPTIYDDIYPATLALSITGDRFFYRSKSRVSLIWEYDRNFRNTGEILINITVQFKEPTNKLRSKIFTENIKDLKDAGYQFNGAFDEFSRRKSNNQSSSTQEIDTQQ